jgi:hypothetical protein
MNGNVVFSNFGIGIVGLYNASRYQNVFSMGTSYVPSADGTALGSMYGIAWTHSNIGGESISGLGHQMLIVTAGDARSVIGDGIWTKYNITGNIFYDQNNTSYWIDPNASQSANFAGYVDATYFRDENNTAYYVDPASTSYLNVLSLTGQELRTGGESLQLMRHTAENSSYEWVGFYSGSKRQAIMLWDAAWGGCTNVATDFCFVAENSQRLVLQSGTTEVLINDGLRVGSTGAGKINAGTVDPIYTIGGTHYATYMAGMTGVKEETTGVIKLNNESRIKNYEYTIDFNSLEEGSDLWLFTQSINIDGRAYIAEDGVVYRTTADELFDNFSALLTPNFAGDVWYEKDVENKTITIYAIPDSKFKIQNSKLEVSYRLTAPRFDWKGWSNYSGDDADGFNLDKLLSKE